MSDVTIQLPDGMRDGQVITVRPPALIILRPEGRVSELELARVSEAVQRIPVPDGIKFLVVEGCDVMAVQIDDQGAAPE